MIVSAPPRHELLAPVDATDAHQKSWQIRRFFHEQWVRYFTTIARALNLKPTRVGLVELSGLTADLPATPVPIARMEASNVRLRLSVYARITQAATSTSSLEVTLSWVDGGVLCQRTVGPVTDNTTATILVDQWIVRADQGTVVEVSTAYDSTGATAMVHLVDVIAEEIL